mmetsp:Transcript_11797/g.25507  ORF Transcript_11797/g.25507 Transcript_11797/m.25507 type:complete len:499 (-) Transcript_11797:12-1508(-)
MHVHLANTNVRYLYSTHVSGTRSPCARWPRVHQTPSIRRPPDAAELTPAPETFTSPFSLHTERKRASGCAASLVVQAAEDLSLCMSTPRNGLARILISDGAEPVDGRLAEKGVAIIGISIDRVCASGRAAGGGRAARRDLHRRVGATIHVCRFGRFVSESEDARDKEAVDSGDDLLDAGDGVGGAEPLLACERDALRHLVLELAHQRLCARAQIVELDLLDSGVAALEGGGHLRAARFDRLGERVGRVLERVHAARRRVRCDRRKLHLHQTARVRLELWAHDILAVGHELLVLQQVDGLRLEFAGQLHRMLAHLLQGRHSLLVALARDDLRALVLKLGEVWRDVRCSEITGGLDHLGGGKLSRLRHQLLPALWVIRFVDVWTCHLRKSGLLLKQARHGAQRRDETNAFRVENFLSSAFGEPIRNKPWTCLSIIELPGHFLHSGGARPARRLEQVSERCGLSRLGFLRRKGRICHRFVGGSGRGCGCHGRVVEGELNRW